VDALNDFIEPDSSSDQRIPRCTWWDHKGRREWVQYDFEKPTEVSAIEVYWFDDTGSGACRIPASWQLLARQGDDWVPVKKSDATFRILISPTPMIGPDRGAKNDNHTNRGFTHEGNELRAFIGKQKNMFVICGDRHWQYVAEDPKTGTREYSCGSASDAHAGGFKESNSSPMHQYLKVKGGFLSVVIEGDKDHPGPYSHTAGWTERFTTGMFVRQSNCRQGVKPCV
jgi:hypothetical protein